MNGSASTVGLPARAGAQGRAARGFAAWPIGLALVVPVALFLFQGDIGLGFADEGFLWYGAQRVLAGEIPIRDFQAYDIGRYYWSAAAMWLAGDGGILPLRAGDTVLMAVTSALAVALLREGSRRSNRFVALAGVTLAFWFYPDFKVADSFAAVLLVAGLSRPLAASSPRSWALAGASVGLAGVIGINHLLYGFVGLALAIVLLARQGRLAMAPRQVAALGAGLAAGYAPVLALHLVAPGFTVGYVDFVRQILESGATNLALPLPGPDDLVALDWQRPDEAVRLASKVAVLTVAPFVVLFWAWLLVSPRGSSRPAPSPVFAAAVLMVVPYAHYAYSRADLVHVAVAALPLLIAAWSHPYRSALARRSVAAIAFVATLSVMLPQAPGILALRGEALESVVVFDRVLRVKPETAMRIALIERLTVEHASGGRSFYAAPYWPGAYALTGRRSPTWEIYSILPISVARQKRELERLASADVGYVAINLHTVDDRDDLGLGHTHPLIRRYLERCFAARADPAARASRVEMLLPSARPCAGP